MQRLRTLTAGTLAMMLVTGVLVFAVLADGRVGSEAVTNDGGAWLLNRDVDGIGHVNRVVGEVSTYAGPFSGNFDVEQFESLIVVTDAGNSQVALVDPTLAEKATPITVSSTTTAFAAPDLVVLVDEERGAVWTLPRSEFSLVQQLADLPPTLTVAPSMHVAVGRTGLVAVADRTSNEVHLLRTGDGIATQLIDDWGATDSVGRTSVGERAVLALDDRRLVIVDGDDVRTLDLDVEVARLQQPGVDATAVVAATATGDLVSIDLRTGASTLVQALDTVASVDPIAHDGCVYAITTVPAPTFHFCGVSRPLPGAGTEIKLTLVNDWVWVNDVDQGDIWFVREDQLELEQVSDWTAALQLTDSDEEISENGSDDEELINNPDADDLSDQVDELDDDDQNTPPVAEDDEANTRQGRPVVVDVLLNDTDEDNDPLTVESLTGVDADGQTATGAFVAITSDGRAVQVVPNEDFTGDVTFGYVVHDGRQGRDDARVIVSVNPFDEATNRPPETVDDNATVRAGSSVALNVLTNDTDPDGDLIVLTGVDAPTGSVTFTPNGDVVYSPDVTSEEGTVTLAYTIADDYGAVAIGAIRIRVRQADSNQKPQARNDVGRTTVGRPVLLNVLDNDVDPDGDPLLAQNLQTLDGSITTAQLTPDGAFLFVPEAPGTYRFSYVVSDGPEVDEAQIRIDVEPAAENRPPIAVVDQVALAIGESRLVRVLDNDGDPDGDVVGIVDWSGADGLEIDEVPGVGFEVTATASAQPRTMFRYWISDGQAAPVRGDVIVSVVDREPVDYPPVAADDTVDVRPGQTSEIQVLRNDYDPEGKVLNIVSPVPAIGEGLLRVSPDGQVLLLTTNADQQFSFDFSYEVEDPAGNRSSAVVNVRIVDGNQPNRAPVAGADIARTSYETPVVVAVLANDFDPDGDPITVESIAQQPTNGIVEILDDDTIVYTPSSGFSGTDSFVYTLVDGYSAPVDSTVPDDQRGPRRDLGEVYVGVMPEQATNRPPTAVDDTSFPEVRIGGDSVVLDVLANDSDPDSDPIQVTEVSVSAIGEAVVASNGATVEYSPPATGDPRQVSFNYSIADGRGGTASAQVTLDLVVDPDPIPPVAVDDTVGPVRAGEIITFDPRLNDIDPDGSAADLVVIPGDPSIAVLADGRVQLTAPEATTDIAYRVRDTEELESGPAFITVLVAENEAPVIEPISVETAYNTPVTVSIHDAVSDPDDDPLVITLGTNRSGGSATVVGQSRDSFLDVEFAPDTDFEGVASFDFVVDDRNGHTVAGAVTITVLPPENRPPTADPIEVAAEAGTPAIVRLPDAVTDPDPRGADIHEYRISGPDNGRVTLQGPNRAGEVTIRTNVDDGGVTDSFTYTVIDGEFSETATVTIEVATAAFAAPTLVADTARTLQGRPTQSVNLLANDVDNSPQGLAGDGLLVTNVGVSPDGTVTRSGNSVVFTPDPDFFGQATFTYTVQDGRRTAEFESTGVVTVDVIGRPAMPQPPSISSVGDQYLIVSWQAPTGDAARAPVTGYVLRYTAANGDSGSIEFDTPTLSHRWNGLTNAVEHCFQVAAVNEAGQGDFSESAGQAACGIPDIRPERPTAPAVEFGNGQLLVRWTPPPNRGSPITNYQLRISGGTQGLSPELGVANQYTWVGLTNGTDYTFEVRAQNDSVENGGWSEWSPRSIAENPLTAPSAPARPTAERGDRQVRVIWQAPADGGDPISLYQVTSSIESRWVDVTPQGVTNSHVWENIPNGTDVSFRVRAINRDPSSTTPGNISPASPVVRTCSVPDSPPQPTVERGDTRATVRWVRPADQGCAITQYRITASNGATQTAPATATSHVFTGLANGTAYTFTVAAINEVVTQDGRPALPSPQSPTVTPAGPPFATNVTEAVNIGVRTVRISWSNTGDNGSPITSYQLQVNGTWTDVGNVTTVTRTEASNGATYTYRVRAVNSVGPSQQTGASRTVTTWNTPGTPSVSASSGGRTVINSSWSTPTTGGAILRAHEARITTAASCTGGTLRSNPNSPEAWGGLAENTSYRVCVRYRNDVGWGNWGSAVARTDAPPPPPPTSWVVETGIDRSCPERDFSGSSNWNGGACNGDGGGWFPAYTSVTVTCSVQGYLAEGTRTWYRMSNGPWPGWYINANTVFGSTAGMPSC